MIEIDNILDVEKHLDGIEVVIFDLDDTLYSEKDYVRSGYRTIAQAFPQIPTMFDELWAAFEKKEPAIDVVFERHNILSQKDEALHLYRLHKPEISLYPGVRDMLGRLKREKKLGIITDGRPEGQHAKIMALDIERLFDYIVITDELGGIRFRKPCEKAFIHICDCFGTPFEKAMYIGDNLTKDISAPEKLGMKTLLFQNESGIYAR